MGLRLTLKRPPDLRLDLRGLTQARSSGAGAGDIERLPVGHGRGSEPLGEFFDVHPIEGDQLLIEGDLSRCDRIGWQWAGGLLVVDGDAGHYLGGLMSGGAIEARGRAGDLAACEMSGGLLRVAGDVGDFAASTLPGSMDGMRGGRFVVGGNAGARFGDRMRRGTALIHGDAGDFLASRLVAGSIALAGRAGAHPAYGMRRGSLVFAGPAPEAAPTFVPAVAAAPVFWQLLARDLALEGGAFATLPRRTIERRLGDLAAEGKGELVLVS